MDKLNLNPSSDSLLGSALFNLLVIPKLKSRHWAALTLGLPMLVISTVNNEPILAGSLFIALILMMFDQKLNHLVKWLNDRIKVWQAVVGIFVVATLLTQWINPATAIPALGSVYSMPQLAIADQTVVSIKLMIVALNCLLIAAVFFTFRLAKGFWVKNTSR